MNIRLALGFLFFMNKLPSYLNSVMLAVFLNISDCLQQILNHLLMNGMFFLKSDVAYSFCYIKNAQTFLKVALTSRTCTF